MTHSHKGFSLIEFVVIISIFAIMAGIGLFSFRGFQTDITVNNLAHDIAITIRNVQTYGTASPSVPNTATGIPRGVSFNADTGGPTPWMSEVEIFDDLDDDAFYTPGIDSLIDTLRVQSEDRIESIEMSSSGIANSWAEVSPGSFAITFKRPFPPIYKWSTAPISDAAYIRIIVSNLDQSRKKAVILTKMGDIRVESVQ